MSAPAEALSRTRSRASLLALSWTDVAVVVAQALVFAPFAALRYVDGDEGDYTLSSQLVLDGERPYTDFLHTQMPLLPYVYGLWTAVWGESWYAARGLSVLFAIALGWLLFRHLAARHGTGLATAGLVLYVSSSLVLGWLTPVKTQALSTLLLFAAYVAVARAGAARWLLAGALVGLAIDTRLIYAAALPAFAWAAWRASGVRRLGAGLALGLVPALVFLVLDPRRFWFDNLGYHAQRSENGLVGDFEQKAYVVANLLGMGTPDGAQPQFLLLVLAAAAAAVVVRALTGRIPFALVVAAWLALASLLPTPTYAQYFVATVPFLIVGAIELAAALRARGGGAWRTVGARALVGAVAVYALLAVADVGRYLRDFADLRIGAVADVRNVVNAETQPGDEVLATWPGYLFGTHAVPVPGTENAYAAHEAAALSPAEARRYRLASADEIERMIESGRPRLVVVRLWHDLRPVPDYYGALRRGGYTHVGRIGTADVYRAPDG